jgi:hypothetical protein
MQINAATITGSVKSAATKAAGLVTITEPLSLSYAVELGNGTDADQANQTWQDERTLAASASETLDLRGVLKDAFGDTVSFARIKALVIKNTSDTGTLTVGGAASNAWQGPFGNTNDTLTIRPGGFVVLAGGDATAYPVTASTADQLKLLNNDSGNALIYEIIVIGATA